MAEGFRPRAVFMAFGTRGDVLPIAAVAAAFACGQPSYHVVLVTHMAHQGLRVHLAAKNVVYIPVSSPPVLQVHQDGNMSDSDQVPFSLCKNIFQTEHRKECLSAIERVFGDSPSVAGDCIVINFFALVQIPFVTVQLMNAFQYLVNQEGWNLAELFQVKCVIAAPYVVPYSAPSSFERRFKQDLPLLYKYFHEAPANTDPVTNLPMWHVRTQPPLLLYGFSKEIVECPGYWPSNVHVCGFWFPSMEWQFSCSKCRDVMFPSPFRCTTQSDELCANHSDLQHFLKKTYGPCLPIFVGLSSIGSMGFLRNPEAFLMVIRAVLEITDYRFILFSAGYEPLDAAIHSIAHGSSKRNELQQPICGENGTSLFNERLFCFSGTIPYSWLFPRCAVAIHHGGSGSTAAALHAGIPQILCPFLLDQFYWAERLCWLGVALEPLQKRHLVPDTDDVASIRQAADALANAIKLALSPKMRMQASKIADRISSEDGVGQALKLLKEKVIHTSK